VAKACVHKQRTCNAGPNDAAKQASSLISIYTVAYFCGKINHLAMITVRPRLAAKI
jgi:hypothetical protein